MTQRRTPLLLSALLALVACQDTPLPTEVEVGEPSFLISDATFGDNEDFFWLPPNVPNPRKDKNFDVDEFDPNFDVTVRICVGPAPGVPGVTCETDTSPPTQFTDVEIDGRSEQYHVNWDTTDEDDGGSPDHHILVVVHLPDGPLLAGFADGDIVSLAWD